MRHFFHISAASILLVVSQHFSQFFEMTALTVAVILLADTAKKADRWEKEKKAESKNQNQSLIPRYP